MTWQLAPVELPCRHPLLGCVARSFPPPERPGDRQQGRDQHGHRGDQAARIARLALAGDGQRRHDAIGLPV